MSRTDDLRQRVLDRLQAERRLPTIVAGVLGPEGLLWSGSAGTGAETDTGFRLGSITKTVTAVLVLQAREAGLLSLEDPLGRFVPGSGYAASTLRALLSHTSGMQSEPVGPWWERSRGDSAEALVAANDGTGAVLAPGEAFHYSNLGFGLLGEVVARVRGRDWATLAREDVLAPLGMHRTSYDAEGVHAQGWSVGHLDGTLTPEPHTDTGAMAPAGQLWSTLEDVVRFALFLRDGRPEVLDTVVLREMQADATGSGDYGLGTMLAPHPDPARRLVGHLGSMPGFQAVCLVDPDPGEGPSGVVALTNATTGVDGTELAHLLLGVGPYPDPSPDLEPWVPSTAVPTWARELVGWWFWGNSCLELRWSNEHLELHDLARRVRAEVFVLNEDGRLAGTSGYHRAETLHVRRHADGSVHFLEVATFVLTRVPYDPSAPTPG